MPATDERPPAAPGRHQTKEKTKERTTETPDKPEHQVRRRGAVNNDTVADTRPELRRNTHGRQRHCLARYRDVTEPDGTSRTDRRAQESHGHRSPVGHATAA